MQKVVYVLLQQHAEEYWQMEHDDDDDIMTDGEMRYRDVRLNCMYPIIFKMCLSTFLTMTL